MVGMFGYVTKTTNYFRDGTYLDQHRYQYWHKHVSPIYEQCYQQFSSIRLIAIFFPVINFQFHILTLDLTKKTLTNGTID